MRKLLILAATILGGAHAADCGQLAQSAFSNATITLAQTVPAGAFTAPGGKINFDSPGMNWAGLTAAPQNQTFCRIAATLKPSPDSNIKLEVWLPENWNGKFLNIGSFGWGGQIMYGGLLTGLSQGYAVANTDTGHEESDGAGGSFLLGHPEKLIDYAYRAQHLTVEFAKAIIKAHYGKPAAFSYMIGCSLGGMESLIEAKHYPHDFDGIVAGAPPNPITRFNAAQMWPGYLVTKNPESIIPKSKWPMINAAVIKRCATPIGAAAGYVDQPASCDFQPAQIQCKGADAPNCLTAPQAQLLQQIYAGPADKLTGKNIFPGPAKGSELELYDFASGKPFVNAVDLFRYAAFANPNWQMSDMDWGQQFESAEAKLAPLMEVDSDLSAFYKSGGKLLMYVGWNDYHNPTELISYYQKLAKTSGPIAKSQTRLFTIPGMNHCAGGAGCDTFNKLAIIDTWVTTNHLPPQIIATHYNKQKQPERTMPLCAWPETAHYIGGDTSQASSFKCK